MVVAEVLSDANHGKLNKNTVNGRSWMPGFLKTAAMPKLYTLQAELLLGLCEDLLRKEQS